MSARNLRRVVLCVLVLLPSVPLFVARAASLSTSPARAAAAASAAGSETAGVLQTAATSSTAKLHPALVRRLDEEGGVANAWVFFTDKGITDPAAHEAALRQLAATYDPRAIQRRLLRGSDIKRAGQVFDENDIPVPPAYVAAVTATGAHLRVVSPWLSAVSVRGTRKQLERIAELTFVDRLEPVGRSRRIDPVEFTPSEPPAPGGEPDTLDYGLALAQLTQINLVKLHDAGFTGQGVIIGILDTGFKRTHEAFNNPAHPLKVVKEWDFINNDPNTGPEPGDPPGQHTHGTLILGTIGAYKPTRLIGGAFDASFILCKTEDIAGEYPKEEDYYVAGLQFIEQNGGDMATSSLGYIDWYTQEQLDGKTAVTTKGVNIATANGVRCCTAAGNEGHDSNPATSHLLAPADAFQVISCGAVSSDGTIAGFSSDGPTADKRVKPEALARGVNTQTVSASNDTGYGGASGTSLSTPLVACVVGCLIQARPQWTVDQMRSNLFTSAGDYVKNKAYDPLYIRGYGVLNAYEAAQDCNGNSVPDIFDIAGGTSKDANQNGVPDECEGLKGDLNCDGLINNFDIDPFVLALTNPNGYKATYPNCNILNADCNRDGRTNNFDIDPFVKLLTP